MSQTVKWWARESWGAPICDPDHRVEIPVGEKCFSSGREITENDKGVMLLHCDEDGAEYRPWLLDEFLRSLGIGDSE